MQRIKEVLENNQNKGPGVCLFDKYALILGGYAHQVPGIGIIDEERAEVIPVSSQKPEIVVDYPFPGKLPSSEKGVSFEPVNWAEDYAAFLEASPAEICPYELMVGETHWNLYLTRGRKFPPETRKKLEVLRKKTNELGADGMGWARTCPDLSIGLTSGWGSILKRIQRAKRKLGTKKEVNYLRAQEIVCTAIMEFIKKHSRKAGQRAEEETDELKKEIYLKVAKACNNISENPPSSFHEALQWIHFFVLVDKVEGACGGYGRLDMLLAPFYFKDMNEGKVTREAAKELLAEFLSKCPHMYCIGGRKKDLTDATNDVSWLILEAYDMIKGNTNLGLMWHEDIDENFFYYACDILTRNRTGSPILINHDVMRQSVINYGIEPSDAWNVAYNGCAWYAVQGKEYLCGDIAGINGLVCLLDALDIAFRTRINGFDQLWELYYLQVEEAFKALRELMDAQYELLPSVWPEMVASMLYEGCIEKGRDITDFAAVYNLPSIQFLGIANVVDSLMAIRQMVFEDKRISFEELERALKANFEGYQTVRQLLLNCPKYGNDDDKVDEIAIKVVESFREILAKYKNCKGAAYRPLIWSHVGHVYAGEIIGATPDGRKAGTPIAQGANPMHGRARSGITCHMTSVLKLDHKRLLDAPVQLELDSALFAGVEDKAKLLRDTVNSYFRMGGIQVNVNVVSVDTLKKAMEHPEEYGHIYVRVTGFTARFVDLQRPVQEEIIGRYRHTKI